MRNLTRAVAAVATASTLAVAPAALAASFVLMTDEDLVDVAAAVVELEIVARDVRTVGPTPFTDYSARVMRTFKGSLDPGATITVRTLGGVLPSARRLVDQRDHAKCEREAILHGRQG